MERDTIARIEAVERDAWLDLFAAAPPRLRDALGVEQRSAGDGALFIVRAIDHIQFNRVGYLGLDGAAVAATVDAAIAAFDAAGVKNWIVHVPDGALELAAACAARGLTPHPRTWAKFVRDGKPPLAAATAFAVREVDGGAGREFGAAAAQGFGMPPVVGEWLAALPGRRRWRCFAAFEGDRAVAAGAMFVNGTAAWLGIGATLASHRGRGAQSALLAARIDAAIRSGCTVLTTETGMPQPGEAAPSYDNIRRAGFAIAYPRPNLRRAS